MLDAVHAVSAVILTVCGPVTMVVPPVNTPKFAFEMKVFSEKRLSLVEVWQGRRPDALELVSAAKVEEAVDEDNVRAHLAV